jgi:nicotinate-nucleotide--dimethylbenzimidazole phosphoribosyltransferase
MKTFPILPVSENLSASLLNKINFKTKPQGALGKLEQIALQIGLVQNTLNPVLTKPVVVVFAGDHGIAKEGVSAYPQEVTFQMVMNFLNGGAAINVFCKQNGLAIHIVDAGVNYEFPQELAGLIRNKIGYGTKNFMHEPAMTMEEAQAAIQSGALLVRERHKEGSNIIGFGEMGIGNTASASVLMSVICKIPLEECVGKGTGLDSAGVRNKIQILRKAIASHPMPVTPIEALAVFGGFEIAQMTGAMLQAAQLGMIVMVDGFIATAAFLVASQMEPHIRDYSIFCHQSGENGHRKMLEFLSATPLINLEMRLGEGTGTAIAYPIIHAAVSFLNEMASFESAGVSSKEENILA